MPYDSLTNTVWFTNTQQELMHFVLQIQNLPNKQIHNIMHHASETNKAPVTSTRYFLINAIINSSSIRVRVRRHSAAKMGGELFKEWNELYCKVKHLISWH